MKKNFKIMKPHYSEQILPVPWPFVIARFHCNDICKWVDFLVFLDKDKKRLNLMGYKFKNLHTVWWSILKSPLY